MNILPASEVPFDLSPTAPLEYLNPWLGLNAIKQLRRRGITTFGKLLCAAQENGLSQLGITQHAERETIAFLQEKGCYPKRA